MLSKKEVKDIQSLRHKKYREESGIFVAEGQKIVAEFLQLIPEQIQNIYATKEWIDNYKHLINDISLQVISEEELKKISALQTPNQVLLIAKQFNRQISSGESFSLYLDAIQDPGNLGTIIRIADWFNIKQVICSTGCADMYNPKVIQASMASIARVTIFYDDEMKWLQQQTCTIYASVLDGTPVYSCEKTISGILLIGNESKGIRPELLSFATKRITIPKKGEAESLNAAVATGILLSHLVN